MCVLLGLYVQSISVYLSQYLVCVGYTYKKAVCDWCQSGKTECTHLLCGHVIHSVRDVVCPIL